jgi:inorganic pyrophosphatase/exopolyphosphatase
MNNFIKFLKLSKTNALTSELPLRLVMGNTSGDMDSIVGALGLAYYLTLKTKLHWTPVVNCYKNDFNTKVEIYKHLV